jgi:hypothetical protein
MVNGQTLVRTRAARLWMRDDQDCMADGSCARREYASCGGRTAAASLPRRNGEERVGRERRRCDAVVAGVMTPSAAVMPTMWRALSARIR